MDWKMMFQRCIIIFGLIVGVHFSKVSYLAHEKLGHSELRAHKAMDHGTIDVSTDSLIPKIVDFQLLKDPMSGWNVHVQVKNFRFAPAHASQPHRSGEGHAHLYINGNKIARIYGDWFHIPELNKDYNEIKLTLNTNDHQTLTNGNQAIEKVFILDKE